MVDDVLEGGSPAHRALMSKLQTKGKLVKVKRLKDDSKGTVYSGVRLEQLTDCSFNYSMDDYV